MSCIAGILRKQYERGHWGKFRELIVTGVGENEAGEWKTYVEDAAPGVVLELSLNTMGTILSLNLSPLR